MNLPFKLKVSEFSPNSMIKRHAKYAFKIYYKIQMIKRDLLKNSKFHHEVPTPNNSPPLSHSALVKCEK